jgi:hypothetical protein
MQGHQARLRRSAKLSVGKITPNEQQIAANTNLFAFNSTIVSLPCRCAFFKAAPS